MFYSILTITYNRSHTIHRLWDSLNRIKERNFEWVIVDNGSVDDTSSLISNWIKDSKFKIIYHQLAFNQGLAKGLNEGKKLLSGDYTIVIDDDDFLMDDAIDTIDRYIYKFKINEMPNVAGLAFRTVDEFGRLIGRPMAKNAMLSNRLNLEYIHKIGSSAEIATVAKTSVRNQYEFIELLPPDHAPNSIILNRMARSYELMYVDIPIRVMYRHDGISRMTNRESYSIKFPVGNYLKSLSVLNSELDFFWYAPKNFVHHARKMRRFGLHIGKNVFLQYSELTSSWGKLLWLIFGTVPGSLGYLRDCFRMRSNTRSLSADTKSVK